MTEPRTLKYLSAARLTGETIGGYCVYVDTPASRALIDISFRGSYVKTTPAAFSTEEAVVLGVGDGRHGFSISLTSLGLSVDEAGDIILRERRYNGTIGCIRLGSKYHTQDLKDKALRLERRIEALSLMLSEAREPNTIATSVETTGALRCQGVGGPCERGPRLGRMSLPKRPKATVILYTSAELSTVCDAALSLIGFCQTHNLELLVAAGDSGDVVSYLPSRIEGVLAFASGLNLHDEGAIPYDAINHAVAAARSQTAFLASLNRDSLEALQRLAEQGLTDDLALVVPCRLTSRGFSRLSEESGDGFAVAFKTSLFKAIGGFEPPEGLKSSIDLFVSKAASFGAGVEHIVFTNGKAKETPS